MSGRARAPPHILRLLQITVQLHHLSPRYPHLRLLRLRHLDLLNRLLLHRHHPPHQALLAWF